VSGPKPDRKRTVARRRLSAAARRDLILAAAKRLFARRGYTLTSLDQVAAAAGVTKPVVYDHFRSKQQLYFALMRALRDELVTSATRSLAEQRAAPQAFRAAIGNFFRQVERDPAMVAILFVQARTEPELAAEWQRLQDEALDALRPLAQALAPRLKAWQLEVALQFVHHALNATAAAWPRQASSEQMTELVHSLLWRGLASVR
jgi:AcrR family transcriptional regulator